MWSAVRSTLSLYSQRRIPFPAFFMAAAFFFAVADCAALPFVRFSAFKVFRVA